MGFTRKVLTAIQWIAAGYIALLLLLLTVWAIAALLDSLGVPGM